jgi:AraC family L-rhamnose operon transcriptional activator RhaR
MRFTELNQLPISFSIGSYQMTILYWGFFEPAYWRNYIHTHSFYEMCYVYQGAGTFQINGETQQVKAGDLFIAKPGEPHEIVGHRQDPMGVYFWGCSLNRRPCCDPGTSPIDTLLDAFARSSCWIISGAVPVKTTLLLLTDEITRRSAGYPSVINALVTKLMLDTARLAVSETILAESVEPPSSSDAESVVRTASQYIRDNIARPISLRDVAAQVHLSERHLGRLFLQVKKTTVGDHITDLRMEAASRLLLDHQWTVKKIAAAVGYPDVRYFTTLFRKRMRVTPAMFRKRGGTAFADESRRGVIG